MMNGAEAIFNTLVKAGIKVCFANPGTSEMILIDVMGLNDNIRPILCLQENVVTGAADGYGRMTKEPAMTLLHLGSGFANGICNLHSGRKANSPIINIVGANASYHVAKDPAHEMLTPIEDLARSTSHWVKTSKNADDLAISVMQAIQIAKLGEGKVATVIAPTNNHWEETTVKPAVTTPYSTPKVSAETIREIATALSNGKRTALYLGNSALYGEGLDLVGRISEATGVDLLSNMVTPHIQRGSGCVPVIQVTLVAEKAKVPFEKYEQIILIGERRPTLEFAYEGKSTELVPDNCRVITMATVEYDIITALKDLAKAVNAPAKPVVLQKLEEKVSAPTGELTDKTMAQSFNMLLPEDAIISDEGITFSFTFFGLTAGARRHDWLFAPYGGGIGNGLPVALGAAIACPERKVVALQADGSAMYTPQALWSMARENTDVCIVILVNNKYVALEMELARVRKGEVNDKMMSTLTLDNPILNWVQIAEGMGVSASRATNAMEFHEQFERCMKTKGPHLIEAQISQDVQLIIDEIRKSKSA